MDRLADLDLCERVEEAGDVLRERERDADRRSTIRGNEGSPPNSSTSSALFALPPTMISSSNSVRVSLQSRLKTLSADKPSSNERILASILGSSPIADEITPSPVARALKNSREIEAELRMAYLTLASPSSSLSRFVSGTGWSPRFSIHSQGRFNTGGPSTRWPDESRCAVTRFDIPLFGALM